MAVVYLDPARVTDKRQGPPPINRSRTGYGGKIPSSWELQLDGRRWHRVYVMQWSNMGTPYVLVKGQQLLLGTYDPHYESRRDPARNTTWNVYWAPEGRVIATVVAKDARSAIRKAPQPYRKYLGEMYAVPVGP